MQDPANSSPEATIDAEKLSASNEASRVVANEERSSDDPTTAAVSRRSKSSESVLKQVETRTRQKSRRRKPPAWAVQLVSTAKRVQHFFRQGLPGLLKRRRRELTTALISIVLHLVAAFLLAAWLLPEASKNEVLQLIGARVDQNDEAPEQLVEIIQPTEIVDLNVDSTVKQMLAELDKGQERIQIDSVDPTEFMLPIEDLPEVGEIQILKGQFGGRSEAGRRAAVSHYGGSAESEKSVSLGLAWLQSIQQPDGSWSFDEVGNAGQPGSLTTTDMGATALALLCYLGSGHTHMSDGPYEETVLKGLTYLAKNAERGSSGADLRGRSQSNAGMYVQGIATICLCEAAAMERDDKELRRLATDAIRFIERAQNKIDGGWRYSPGESGDTSVAGWQIMALQSARAARLSVKSDSLRDARKFLNLVQSNDGAMYGYVPGEGPRDSMTAVGLLCRMYLGWKRDNPALKVGVEHLASRGPQPGNIYHNYYATQVVHHWGGELWNQWNLKMREELVTTQIKTGPGAGSWDVADPHGAGGGRIYQTALSLLTLEVYYRHLPIYRRFDEQMVDDATDVSAK